MQSTTMLRFATVSSLAVLSVVACSDESAGKATGGASSEGSGKAPNKKKRGDNAEHVIHVRFHLLKAPGSKWLDTTVGEKEVKKWLGGANDVWKAANIRFELDKVLTEDAIEPKEHDEAIDAFAALKKKGKKSGEKTGKKDRRSWSKDLKDAKKAQSAARLKALPQDNRIGKGIDVFVIGRLPAAGGVFGCPLGAVIYSERRGKGLNISKVLAHELGHALRLPHTKCADDKNLMMEGGCKQRAPENISLNADQIAIARKVAATGRARPCNKGETSVED